MLEVVFRTRERYYTMLVQPRWKKTNENGHMLGAKIVSISGGWGTFVTGMCRPFVAEAA